MDGLARPSRGYIVPTGQSNGDTRSESANESERENESDTSRFMMTGSALPSGFFGFGSYQPLTEMHYITLRRRADGLPSTVHVVIRLTVDRSWATVTNGSDRRI
jgi:hypothetical protein